MSLVYLSLIPVTSICHCVLEHQLSTREVISFFGISQYQRKDYGVGEGNLKSFEVNIFLWDFGTPCIRRMSYWHRAAVRDVRLHLIDHNYRKTRAEQTVCRVTSLLITRRVEPEFNQHSSWSTIYAEQNTLLIDFLWPVLHGRRDVHTHKMQSTKVCGHKKWSLKVIHQNKKPGSNMLEI